MEHLEQENLISGVVDAHTESAVSDGVATTAPVSVSSENVMPEDVETVMKRVLDSALAEQERRIAEAEERGFRRAVDMARQNPESLGISRSVPNFLADVRPDIWNS